MRNASLICMDGCLSAESMDFITDFCHQHNIPGNYYYAEIFYSSKAVSFVAWSCKISLTTFLCSMIFYASAIWTKIKMLHCNLKDWLHNMQCPNYFKIVLVLFEPTDINQVEKLFNSNAWKKLTYVTPNINELQIFHHFLKFQENLISVKGLW